MIPMSDEIVAQKALIFGKYDTSEVVVNDGGLAKYIDLTPTNVPHSGGKHANRWFGKSKLSIVERLINNIMRTEKYTGKKRRRTRPWPRRSTSSPPRPTRTRSRS